MAISVLIVDDDPSFRDLARRLLTASDFEVAGQAGSVAEAIAAANAIRPDAALVDVDLAGRERDHPDPGADVASVATAGRAHFRRR